MTDPTQDPKAERGVPAANTEERRLRDALRAAQERIEELERERDEAVEAHEEMKRARDDVRDEKWDEYLNAKCAELVQERDSLREQVEMARDDLSHALNRDHSWAMIEGVHDRLDRALSPPDTSP
jgi:uncharacterized coiled-coil DUF342 family protein